MLSLTILEVVTLKCWGRVKSLQLILSSHKGPRGFDDRTLAASPWCFGGTKITALLTLSLNVFDS